VLQRIDKELTWRGEMFRKLGVNDLPSYRQYRNAQPPAEQAKLPPVPRQLLLIDEFQEFFVEDDSIAQTASVLFDRIVRQGRAFGIHVLLGSQTLGGAYTLARATLGQMAIRVALQCNEADAYLIMDDNNAAPRLLSRPGEGIYIDEAFDLTNDEFAKSVLLHELVHHLQRVSGTFQKMPSACDRWYAAEREAYIIQNRYLEHAHDPHRLNVNGWRARCDD